MPGDTLEDGNFVSRGYKKLSGAAKVFHFDFRDKTVLDIGSSTGGFTQYAIEQGAKRIIAVEKGTNQMKFPLRNNPRIDLYEKTDIFDFKIPSSVDTVVADVSFISIAQILYYIRPQLAKGTDLLIMLKPQFEAHPSQLNRGIVKNETIRRSIIKNFEAWLKQNHFVIVKKHDNTLSGKNGNKERFYWLKISQNI